LAAELLTFAYPATCHKPTVATGRLEGDQHDGTAALTVPVRNGMRG
jgi:hypothetical protein